MERKIFSLFVSFLIILTLFAIMTAEILVFDLIKSKKSDLMSTISEDRTTLTETENYGDEYISKIIFLGESTTYGLKHYGILKDGFNTCQVWTGAKTDGNIVKTSGTLSLSPYISSTKIYYPETGEALTINEAVALKKPQYLIITLGLNNGASYYGEDEFKSCYKSLINSIKNANSSTKIILQSIFPVSNECQISVYTPSRIKECNGWIYEIARDCNVKYLNTTECLETDEGYLIKEYSNGDGIHLSKDGLTAVIEYIKTHGYGDR